jgi:hypothetical protein
MVELQGIRAISDLAVATIGPFFISFLGIITLSLRILNSSAVRNLDGGDFRVVKNLALVSGCALSSFLFAIGAPLWDQRQTLSSLYFA